ncbi:MAG: hypothetical protein WAX85_02430 [Minisyncoccia bacterium]
MNADKATIKQLAEVYLNEEGKLCVDIFLEEGRLRSAQACVLGAIDYCWTKKEIGDAEARTAYELLGMDSAVVEDLRTNSKWFKKPSDKGHP